MDAQYKNRIMIDTNALIKYLKLEMNSHVANLSALGSKTISDGLSGKSTLFLTSLSIIEIWNNLPKQEDALLNFKTLVRQLYEDVNIRIVELSSETLKEYVNHCSSTLIKEHDKIIYSAAKEFSCNIIVTCDRKIISYNETLGFNKLEIIE